MRRYPFIQWREPLAVRLLGDATEHYACRICIAIKGLKGADIGALPTDPNVVREHLRAEHL
jgi:hypothetical protein